MATQAVAEPAKCETRCVHAKAVLDRAPSLGETAQVSVEVTSDVDLKGVRIDADVPGIARWSTVPDGLSARDVASSVPTDFGKVGRATTTMDLSAGQTVRFQGAVKAVDTGTLLISDLHPGRNLYLLGTGTGLAPWLSIIKDPDTYERFDKVVLTHGVRHAEDLAYRDYFEKELPQHEFLGETIREKLLYYPAVTREDFVHQGRLTDLMASGAMMDSLGIEPLDAAHDRAMICGSPQMLADFRALLDGRGFTAAPRIGTAGQYVFERAFVEK